MAMNFSGRDRLAQALMGNMARAQNTPTVAAGRGGGGRAALAPVAEAGAGWNGYVAPMSPGVPAPVYDAFGGQRHGLDAIAATGGYPIDPAVFGGKPHGLDAIAQSGGYPSGKPLAPAPAAPSRGVGQSFGVPPGGTEPFFPPNDVYSAPAIDPGVFGGQPYGLAGIAASGGYPIDSSVFGGKPHGLDAIAQTGGVGPSSFDYSVYGNQPGVPGYKPPPTPVAQFGSGALFGDAGRRPDDGLTPDVDPITGDPIGSPDPGGGGSPPGGGGNPPGGGGNPPGGDPRGGGTPPGPPDLPPLDPPIDIVDHPVTPGPNDNPIIGLGGPPTEVPPHFGTPEFDDRFGGFPSNPMDPAPPFDFGVPGFGPGQTPAVGPDNPYQSYGSTEPLGGYGPAEPVVDIELAADQPGDFYDYGDLDEDVDAGDYGGDDEE